MIKITSLTTMYRASLIARAIKPWLIKGQTCLDVGCGNGVVASHLGKTLDIQITGCDILNYLEVNLPFKKMATPKKLPFMDDSFEFVMLNDVLHHMDYPTQIDALTEAIRVAKKIIIFEEKPTIKAKMFDYLLNKIHNAEMNIPLAFRTKNDWVKLFKSLGYRFEAKEVSAPAWYPFSHLAFQLRIDNTQNIK